MKIDLPPLNWLVCYFTREKIRVNRFGQISNDQMDFFPPNLKIFLASLQRQRFPFSTYMHLKRKFSNFPTNYNKKPSWNHNIKCILPLTEKIPKLYFLWFVLFTVTVLQNTFCLLCKISNKLHTKYVFQTTVFPSPFTLMSQYLSLTLFYTSDLQLNEPLSRIESKFLFLLYFCKKGFFPFLDEETEYRVFIEQNCLGSQVVVGYLDHDKKGSRLFKDLIFFNI